MKNKIETVEYLLTKNIDINQKNKADLSCMMYACMS